MRKRTWIIVLSCLLVATAIGGVLAYNTSRQVADYSDIEAAVAAQRFADDLHRSQPASFDCDNSSEDCRALRYYVTADKCETVVEEIVSSQAVANPECEPTKSNFAFNGQAFGVQLAKLDVGYELTVWNRK